MCLCVVFTSLRIHVRPSVHVCCVSDLGLCVLLCLLVPVGVCRESLCVCVVCLGFCVIVYVQVNVS